MGDVKRYTESCMEGGGVCPSRDGEFVTFLDYEAALAREAALREELAQTKRTAITEIEALHRTMYGQAKDLTAAEQRNAELIELLRETLPALALGASAFKSVKPVQMKVRAALKPTESGASE